MTKSGKTSNFIPAQKNFLGELLVFWVCRRSLWRSFHAVHFRAAEPLPAPSSRLTAPIIFFANHSSWWDGYLAHVINRQVYGLDGYLMMDVRQLQRFPFFRWAGCFSVDQENGRSALQSVNYIGRELNQKTGRTLWIFPQGQITPQERRPLGFHSGLTRVIKHTGACYLYPVACRFEFLEEQYPDIFIDVGKAIYFPANAKIDAKDLTQQLETVLTQQLDALREQVSQRQFDDFITIIRGKNSTNTTVSRLANLLKKITIL